MLRRSNIGWCDYSGGDLNVVIRGRSCPTSEGCVHCYVKRWFDRYREGKMPECSTIYPEKVRRLWRAVFEPGDQPYRRGPGSKPIMFVDDFGDLFAPDVPDHFIFSVLDVCNRRRSADWVLLTKRIERMLGVTNDWLEIYGETPTLPSNIWCLVTAETQERANERLPMLLQVKARVRGVSIEPMLEPISLEEWLPVEWSDLGHCWVAAWPGPAAYERTLSWVILGAESGRDRRHFDVKWAYTPYEQCAAAGVPFFGKQDSGLGPGVPLLIEGREIKEFPRRSE